MNRKTGRKGFTLVEMMAAVFLSGAIAVAALPLVLAGEKRLVRQAEEENMAVAGDGIFMYVSEAVKTAGKVCISRGKENVPEGEAWSCIYAEDGGVWKENGKQSREIFGSGFLDGAEVFLDAEASGRDGLRLTVELTRNGRTVYRRTDVVPLLNLSLNLAGRVEDRTEDSGYEDGKETLILWYQNMEGAEEWNSSR